MARIINIFGGPGTGKSTTAAGVFQAMKKQRMEVELVTEYAKDMTWEGRSNVLTDQLYILAKQNRRLHRLKGQVDWVISDSPLLLGLMYMPPNYFETFTPFLLEVFHSYDNVNFLLGRDFDYSPVGRNQTVEEAEQIDSNLMNCLANNDIDCHRITNDPGVDRVEQILNICWSYERSPDLLGK